MLWAWVIAAFMLLAVGWTGVVLTGRRPAEARRATIPRVAAVALVAIAVVGLVRFSVEAPDTEHADEELSLVLAELVSPTAAALEDGVGAADGKAGHYLVMFDDAVAIGSQGYGLLNELERRGFDVGMDPGFAVIVTRHRALDAVDATARVVLATGVNAERWSEVPDAVEVARTDPRSPAEREEFDELRSSVIEELRAAGLEELVPGVDTNLFGTSIDARAPTSAQQAMSRMAELGVPTAVFVVPPEVGSAG
jgi:hypothetical protein